MARKRWEVRVGDIVVVKKVEYYEKDLGLEIGQRMKVLRVNDNRWIRVEDKMRWWLKKVNFMPYKKPVIVIKVK